MLDFNKISKTINQRNFDIKYFIPKVTNLTEQGYRLAIKRKTLKVKNLEEITIGLNLKMSYWWDEEEDLITTEKEIKYESAPKKENQKLKIELEQSKKTIANLNDHIWLLKEKLEIYEPKKKVNG